MEYRKTVCIDFDGTLVDHEYPKVGKLKLNAKEAVETFKLLGWHIIISSCRTSQWADEVFRKPGEESLPVMERQGVVDMVNALNDAGIPYDEIDDGSKGKPMADLYVDDKGFRFQDNWEQIMQWVVMMEAAA